MDWSSSTTFLLWSSWSTSRNSSTRESVPPAVSNVAAITSVLMLTRSDAPAGTAGACGVCVVPVGTAAVTAGVGKALAPGAAPTASCVERRTLDSYGNVIFYLATVQELNAAQAGAR